MKVRRAEVQPIRRAIRTVVLRLFDHDERRSSEDVLVVVACRRGGLTADQSIAPLHPSTWTAKSRLVSVLPRIMSLKNV